MVFLSSPAQHGAVVVVVVAAVVVPEPEVEDGKRNLGEGLPLNALLKTELSSSKLRLH